MGFFSRFLARVAHLRGAWDAQAWWADGVIFAHGPYRVFARFIEGQTQREHEDAPSPYGSFHLEIRVARYKPLFYYFFFKDARQKKKKKKKKKKTLNFI
jgi:hypothetical protein